MFQIFGSASQSCCTLLSHAGTWTKSCLDVQFLALLWINYITIQCSLIRITNQKHKIHKWTVLTAELWVTISIFHCHSRACPVSAFPIFLSAVRYDSHSALLYIHKHNTQVITPESNRHTQFSWVLALNIPSSSVWFDTVTESKSPHESPHDEHHPKKFQIRSMTKLSAWLTRMINSHACTSGQSCLFMKWTATGPSWLWYCETEEKREHNITMLDQEHNPVISRSYAMLSASAAYIDGELYHTVNTRLHCLFKYLSIKGVAVSPIFCVDSKSRQRTPVQARGPSQLCSKHFPSQRSNHLPSDRPLGPHIQGQVQRSVLGEAGRDWRRERERTKGTLAKRKRCKIARDRGGGFEGGSQASWCIGKGGEEVLQQRWRRQRKADGRV